MKLEEMRALDEQQLKNHVQDCRKELLKERVAANRNKKANKPHLFAALRKQIAQAYTIMNQKRGSHA